MLTIYLILAVVKLSLIQKREYIPQPSPVIAFTFLVAHPGLLIFVVHEIVPTILHYIYDYYISNMYCRVYTLSIILLVC